MSNVKKQQIKLTINGKQHVIQNGLSRTLLQLLREDLGLTGTKQGCGIGECGACTVLLNGKPVNSCLVLVGQLDGCSIRTIEGLAQKERLHPIQKAFIEEHAIQCGFCTPGFIMTTVGLLENNLEITEEQIREALAGNLCRCTGYVKIIKAVKRATREMKDE